MRITRQDQENIHRNVLRVLEEVGCEFGHPRLLEALASIGARIDRQRQRAFFPRTLVEDFLAACPRVAWEGRVPRLTVQVSFYWGKYEDPDSGALGPINERRVAEYFTLARALPRVNLRFMTGCPWAPTPDESPLYERFYCWKYGVTPSGILHPLALAPCLKDLYRAYAELKGKRVADIFVGSVFMMSPLRLSPEEAAQFVWWWDQGCRVTIANMTTAGLTAPVTPAGLVVVNLAEQLAAALLRKACYGETRFAIYAMVAAADPRTMIRPYGRPEMPIGVLLAGAMARFYGVAAMGHGGLTDAKRPSCEAGAQKAISSLACLLNGIDGMLELGLLSIDEIHSPIQMILDHELAGALLQFLKPIDTSDAAIGFETIREVGPGGVFCDQPHTAARFRDSVWEPDIWSREMLAAWEAGDRKIDVDHARDRYHALIEGREPVIELTEEEQQELLAVIRAR